MSRLLAPRLRTLSPAASLARPSTSIRLSSSFKVRPSPPKLPAEEQAEFERLQREASVSQAFHPESTTTATTTNTPAATSQPDSADDGANPAFFRGAPPEFEGEKNPKTGEVGGPKNEPLRWGGQGDWSYNGRVTDF